MAALLDGVRVALATIDSTTISLGDPILGFRGVADAGGVNGLPLAWVVEANFDSNGNPADREGGIGVWTETTNRLVRNTTWSSSPGNTPITITGDSHVIITPLATDQEIDPRWFGVQLNTSTDQGSRFDAFLAFLNGSGLTGRLPVGTIRLTAPSSMTSPSNFKLAGHGDASVLEYRHTVDGQGLQFLEPVDLEFEDFKIDMGTSTTAHGTHGMSFQNPTRCRANRITVFDFAGAGILWFANTTGYGWCGITNCRAYGNNEGAIGFEYAGGMHASYMDNNYSQDVSVSPGIGHQIKNACTYCYMSNCIAVDCLIGAQIGTSADGSFHCRATNIIAKDCTTGALMQASENCYMEIHGDMAGSSTGGYVLNIGSANVNSVGICYPYNVAGTETSIRVAGNCSNCAAYVPYGDGIGLYLAAFESGLNNFYLHVGHIADSISGDDITSKINDASSQTDNVVFFRGNRWTAGAKCRYSNADINGILGYNDKVEFDLGAPTYGAVWIKTTTAGAGGPTIILQHDTASPAANDVSGVSFFGKSSTGVNYEQGMISCIVDDATNASKDTRFQFSTQSNGSSGGATNRVFIGPGLQVGSPTGGMPAAGEINATAVRDDNTLLTCYVWEAVKTGEVDFDYWDGKVFNVDLPPVTEKIIDADEVRDEKGEVVKPAEWHLEEVEPAKTVERIHEPARQFAARLGTEYDPTTIVGQLKHVEDKKHLTPYPNPDKYSDPKKQLSTGEWIQRGVEMDELLFVYIAKQQEQIDELRAAIGAAKEQANG